MLVVKPSIYIYTWYVYIYIEYIYIQLCSQDVESGHVDEEVPEPHPEKDVAVEYLQIHSSTGPRIPVTI